MTSKKHTPLRFSSLDVALRETETAIMLFFHYGDVVAIHILASSAAEIFDKLCKERGIPGGLHSQIEKRIVKERRKEVVDRLREAHNFFKHGQTKGKKTVKFNPSSTEYVLFDCCDMYRRLVSERRRLIKLFEIWFFSKSPELLINSESERSFQEIKKVADPNQRTVFYNSMLQVVDKLIVGKI